MLPFFYLLADLGFTAYIVQADTTGRRMLSTGFWFSTVAGLLLCAAVVGIAPLFGLVFRSDEVVPVLQVLALAVVLTAVCVGADGVAATSHAIPRAGGPGNHRRHRRAGGRHRDGADRLRRLGTGRPGAGRRCW